MSNLKALNKSTSSSAPEFTKKLENVTCQIGQAVDLECCVRGYPAPEVTWEVAGEPVATTRCIRTEREGEKCRLHIKACTANEAQAYTCLAVNKLGKATTTSNVKLEGSIEESGAKVKNCRGTRTAVWPPKSPPKKINVTARPNIPKHMNGETISSLSKKFSGTGIVSPTKTDGTQPSKLDKSHFLKRPPTFLMPPHGKSAQEGETVRLTCSIAGEPEPTVSWEKSGSKINSGGRFSMLTKERIHILEICDAQVDDSGSYTAVLDNSSGSNSAGMYLEIRPKTPDSAIALTTPRSAKADDDISSENGKTSGNSGTSTPSSYRGSNDGDEVSDKSLTKSKLNGKQIPVQNDLKKPPPLKSIGKASNLSSDSSKKIAEVPSKPTKLVIPKVELKKTSLIANYQKAVSTPNKNELKTGKSERTSPPKDGLPRRNSVASKYEKLMQSKNETIKNKFEKKVQKLPAPSEIKTKVENAKPDKTDGSETKSKKIPDSKPDEPEKTPSKKYITNTKPSEISSKAEATKEEAPVSKPETVEAPSPKKLTVGKSEGKPPTFVRTLQDIVQDDGGTVTFTVQVAGTQPIEIVWVHNANEVQDSSEFRYVTSPDGCTHSLVIGEVFPEDAGLYSCEAYNKFGDTEVSCKLIVKEMEDVGNESKNEDANVIHQGSRKQSRQEEPLQELYKEPETKTEVNDFKKCDDPDVTTNGKISEIPEILITEVPIRPITGRITAPQILKGPQSLAILRGETIVLRTHFIGSPPPKVTWLKGGDILKENERTKIDIQEGLTVLTVKNAASDDSGKYVVTIENNSGSDCLFASVSVEGCPDPPGEKPLVSDVNSHSAVLCWRGSPFDGGSVITGYIVEKCSLPEMRWLQVSRASHTTCINIRDLLPDRRYIFRVRAENVHGPSQPSPESDPIFTVDDDDTDSAIMDSKIVEICEGHVFNERFDLQDTIGKGRFGVVYRCIEKRTGHTKAAKIIRCVKSKDRLKVREEIEIMNRLRHPKLLQLLDAFESAKEMTLVMEYVSGGELFERIIADDFVLLERDCVLFVQQICEAVKYMHDCNAIHLDLKPENILCESKTSHQIKIIDFGLAKLYDPSENIRVLFGTPEFVAPEVIGYEPVGPFSDMWSVGVICYVLLTGLSPFMGDNDSETFTNITRAEYDFDDESFDQISEDAKDFISQLFIKRPEKRLTAVECLKHTWLATEQNRMSSVQISTDKLKRFIIRRKWQKTGNAIRALGRMVNLSGVFTSRTPVVTCHGSVTSDSDYSSNSPYSSLTSSGRETVPILSKHDELDGDGSGESGVGDTDSVGSSCNGQTIEN